MDTSVLVDFLAGRQTSAVKHLERIVSADATYYVTPLVVQEILQGARDDSQWRTLHSYLTSLLMVHPRDPVASHVDAARIYVDCRRRGLTVRGSVDCLVAQVALDNQLALLHSDRDFDAIARVRPLSTLS